MNEISVGMQVRLQSGGPRMTVERVDGEVTCVWFDKNACMHRMAIARELLSPATPRVAR